MSTYWGCVWDIMLHTYVVLPLEPFSLWSDNHEYLGSRRPPKIRGNYISYHIAYFPEIIVLYVHYFFFLNYIFAMVACAYITCSFLNLLFDNGMGKYYQLSLIYNLLWKMYIFNRFSRDIAISRGLRLIP